MKAQRKNVTSVDSGEITAQTYVARALEFARARGGGFVIRAIEGPEGSVATRQPATEPQWIAWMLYLGSLGVPTVYARRRGMTTVPCEWPEDFDPACPLSDRGAVLPRRWDPGERAAVAAGVQRLRDRIAALGMSRRPDKPRSLDELGAEYAAKPARLSAELARRITGESAEAAE